MSDLNVVCVLKTGSFYNLDYVEKLRRGVARHLKTPYNFFCLTDDPEVPLDYAISLLDNYPGWWSKLEIFRDFKERTLFLDLDTIIVGSLDELVGHNHKFMSIEGFFRPIFNSGFMSWDGDYSYVYRTFKANSELLMGTNKGDQLVIGSLIPKWGVFQKEFPGQVVSYKQHCRNKGIPRGAKVICFHGKPRPHEVSDGWMKEHWR